MQDTTSPRDLDRLRALLGNVERLLGLAEERLSARTQASGWSALEHLFHLILANDLSLRNARDLARGRGRLRVELEGERDPRALAILARGRLPRGTQAPRFVVPPARPDPALARSIHAETRAAAESPEMLHLAEAPLAIPHQALGPLTAAEWVRFARMHSAHHLAIVRIVLGTPAA